MSTLIKIRRVFWPQVGSCLGVLGVILGTALVFAVLMRSVGSPKRFLPKDRPTYWYEAHMQYAMNYALESKEANSVIFLGGSSCLEGVQPVLFERLSGLRAYNLGCVGMLGFDGMEVVFRAYLRHHPVPRVLVLCIHPSEVCLPLSKFGPMEIHDHFMECYDDDVQGHTCPRRDSTLADVKRGAQFTRHAIFDGLADYENTPLLGSKKTYAQLARDVARNRGYWGLNQAVGATVKHSKVPGYPFAAMGERCQEIDSLCRLAQSHGVKFMIRFTPIPREGSLEDRDPLSTWSSGVQAMCPGAIISQPEMLLYDSSRFADALHTNQRGAADLTAFLAAEVQRFLVKPASPSRTKAKGTPHG